MIFKKTNPYHNTMKKLLLITVSICAFVLCSCKEKPRQYTYVEPEENIADTIWNLLTQEHPEVKPVIDEAIDFDYFTQEEVTESISKTELKYEYFVPQGYAEEDNYIVAIYRLKCYQMLDESWIGLVTKAVHGYGLQEEDCGEELFAVHYNDGTITPYDIDKLCPDFISFAKDYLDYPTIPDDFVFENSAFTMANTSFWPIKYNWNGEVFSQDPESFIMENSVGLARGEFTHRQNGDFYMITVGDNDYMENHDFTDNHGNVLAHFDVKDGIIEGFSLESPSCGVAQDIDYDTILKAFTIISKPIALGCPIQNVLNYKQGYWMKDTVVSQGTKDGKYVITQQIAHDKIHKKRDIFIDYTAQDEHSNIEEIRVYSHPITITLAGEVNESEGLATEVKEIFNSLNYNFSAPEFGDFDYFMRYSDSKNGFDAHFKGEVREVRFQTYKADGKDIVVIAKYGEDEKLTDINTWYYENGSFRETILDLPIPLPEEFEAYTRNNDYSINLENYILTFNDLGIQYFALSDRNDGASMRDEDGIFINHDFYTIKYQWNGKKFE